MIRVVLPPHLRTLAKVADEVELDLSHEPPDSLLPQAVASGDEPFLIVGAMAGG